MRKVVFTLFQSNIEKGGDTLKLRFKGDYLILAASLIWGTTAVISKVLLDSFDPMSLSFYRFLIAGASLLLGWTVVRIFGKASYPLTICKSDLKIILLCGVFGIGLCFAFYNLGLYYSTATITTLLFNFNPIFSLLIVALILRTERIEKREILGAIVGFVGATLVIVNGKPLEELFAIPYFLGYFFALLSAFLWSVYTITTVTLTKKYGAISTNLWAFGLGVIVMLPLMQLQNSTFLNMVRLNQLILLILLGVINTNIAFLLYSKGIESATSISSVILLNLTPLYTMSFAYVLLNEIITGYIIVGGLLVILGVSLAFPPIRSRRK